MKDSDKKIVNLEHYRELKQLEILLKSDKHWKDLDEFSSGYSKLKED